MATKPLDPKLPPNVGGCVITSKKRSLDFPHMPDSMCKAHNRRFAAGKDRKVPPPRVTTNYKKSRPSAQSNYSTFRTQNTHDIRDGSTYT